VALIVIGLVGYCWAAWVSGGVTDMIEIVSNSIAGRLWCVHLGCISGLFRRLLGVCGISMFGIGNVDVSFEISSPSASHLPIAEGQT